MLQGQRPALPPEDSTASSLTYDNWFTLELPEDIREEFRHLDRLIAEREAKERADEPQPSPDSVRPWLVDSLAGDFEGGRACWVCYSALMYSNRRAPKFRACYHCLTHDRNQASKLGLKMLLPLMNWHSQPVLSGSKAPDDPVFRGWLVELWSQVSLLESWRIDGIRAGIALLGLGDQPTIESWVAAMRPGPHRSSACWEAFMAGYHPRLHDVLTRIDRINQEGRQTPPPASPA